MWDSKEAREEERNGKRGKIKRDEEKWQERGAGSWEKEKEKRERKQVGGRGRLKSETKGRKGIWMWDLPVEDNGSPLPYPLLLTEGHISVFGQMCIRVWAA